MVVCEEMVGGPYVTDVQGRRSDGGHMVVQKTIGERVRLRRPGGVPPPAMSRDTFACSMSDDAARYHVWGPLFQINQPSFLNN